MMYSALIAGLLATTVSAHGGVSKYTFGGKDWVGWSPYNPQAQSTIQRLYTSYDPILTTTGNNMRCNNAGQTSQLHGEIAAGSDITATWAQWTHAEGPVTVYMAKCPGSCADFDGSGNVWFKIDQAGLLSGTLGKGQWGNGIVLDTLKWTSKIPAALAPGNYLIRHELLALHQANTPQFYPECAQLTVTGSGTASPGSDYLVAIPGVFKMTDPGILVDIYSPGAATQTTYQVPGPNVWTGQAGGVPPVSSTKSTTAPGTTTTPPPVSTSTTRPPVSTTTTTPPTQPVVAKYGQCGGQGYTGGTVCESGSTCTKSNDYYSQCL